MLAFMSFSSAELGQNEPWETRAEGWDVGKWWVGGRPEITALLQGKLSFQAAWQWSDFHLHSSPGGDKPVLRASSETQVQRLSRNSWSLLR